MYVAVLLYLLSTYILHVKCYVYVLRCTYVDVLLYLLIW